MTELEAYKEGIAEGIRQERKRVMALLESKSYYREWDRQSGSHIIIWDAELRRQLEEKEKPFYPRVVIVPSTDN